MLLEGGIPNFTRTVGWEIKNRNFNHYGKHYDKSFKERAIKLSIASGNISQVAKELGVSDSQLSKWRKNFEQYGINSFPSRLAVNSQHEKRRFAHHSCKIHV